MSTYTLLYLPVNKPLVDGCKIVTPSGEVHEYSDSNSVGWNKATIRVAEPFLVEYKFNEQFVVGRPSPNVLRWLKNGDKVKRADCVLENMEPDAAECIFKMKCPTCQRLH